LVFDLNDFDETHPGPFEWDVKRLAASLEIAGRDNGYTVKQRRQVVLSAANSYRTAMREFAAQSNLAVWYAHQTVQPGLPGLSGVESKKTRRSLQKGMDEARMRDNLGSLKKLTELVDGRLRFVSKPPLVVPSRELALDEEATADLAGWMADVLHKYSQSLESDRRHLIQQYTFIDLARKVVGVGSVGTRAWIMLLSGIDDQDPLLLQAKEANASVLEAHTSPSAFGSHGERVVQRSAPHAGVRGRVTRVALFPGQPTARLLRASTSRLEGILRDSGTGSSVTCHVRRILRVDLGARPCTIW